MRYIYHKVCVRGARRRENAASASRYETLKKSIEVVVVVAAAAAALHVCIWIRQLRADKLSTPLSFSSFTFASISEMVFLSLTLLHSTD